MLYWRREAVGGTEGGREMGGAVDTREWERKRDRTWWRGEKPAVYVRHSGGRAAEGRGA